ncbi:MAG: DUF5615 family PIN-like protein [Planctomycetaceae bacterium]
MVRLFADEQFPARATRRLRLLGYNVLTVQDINFSKYGDSKTDQQVLEIAMNDNRAVVTLNRKDFVRLAEEIHWHSGIIVCVRRRRGADHLARAIDRAIKDTLSDHRHLTGILIRVG